MKVYTVCDKEYKQIVKTPIKEQAVNFAINKAKRTGEIYGVGEGAFKYIPQDWYSKNGFIARM